MFYFHLRHALHSNVPWSLLLEIPLEKNIRAFDAFDLDFFFLILFESWSHELFDNWGTVYNYFNK